MSDGIEFTFSGANGQSIGSMFAECADPREVLDDFGQYKTREIRAAMAPGGILEAAPAGVPPFIHHSGGGVGFAATITHNIEGRSLEVGTHDPRGAILQYGGMISATDKLLTIPISEESYGKRASDFPDLTVTFRRTAHGLLAFLVREHEKIVRTTMGDKKGVLTERGGKKFRIKEVKEAPDFLFILKAYVQIQPHPYLVWTLDDERYLLIALSEWFNRN